MKTKMIAVLAAMAFAVAAPSAQAAGTVGGAGLKSAIAAEQSLAEKTHFRHRTCRRGVRGWHRHTRFGKRIRCKSPRRGGKYRRYRR